MDITGLIDKTEIVPFVNAGSSSVPNWVRIEKGTSLTLSLNPQIKTFEFISKKNAQEEVVGYQPSLPQSLVMFKGEKDYELFFNLLFTLPIGGAAHKEALIVFYQEKGTTHEESKPVYKAWLSDCVVKFNQLDASGNESIDFDLSFNDITSGAVSLETGSPVFMKGSWNGAVFTADT